ncbi:uncharacterized protein DS421_13g407040 [Arachis hypogaea]|nr:uncharacterized protein DS421_13g407040 [Arachis hypogaea]
MIKYYNHFTLRETSYGKLNINKKKGFLVCYFIFTNYFHLLCLSKQINCIMKKKGFRRKNMYHIY